MVRLHTAHRMRLLAAACASGALLVTGAAASPAAPATTAESEWYQTEVVFGDGSSLITRVDTGSVSTTPADDDSAPSEAQQAAEDGSVTTTGEPVVEPSTATPRGYTLHGNNKIDDYHYRSDKGLAKLDRCNNGECTVQASVKVQLKETLNGGSSHRWTLGLHTDHASGNPYAFSYDYYCGVNVPNETDWTCETRDATADGHYSDDPVHSSTGTYNRDLSRDFGVHETSRTKFPMVAYHISWPGFSPVVHIKYRGWDIRRYSGVWKLAPATGTGH